MGWIIAIIVGGIAGWLASMVMARDASMGIFWNIIVGIIGALIGNFLAGALFGIEGTIQTFNLTEAVVAQSYGWQRWYRQRCRCSTCPTCSTSSACSRYSTYLL